MLVLNARNVNDAFPQAISILKKQGLYKDSRNGPVLEYPAPVCTAYSHPCERVIFTPGRKAHPYFHFFEALWILAGRKDVAFPAQFVERMREFSDDGTEYHAAYGDRLRKLHGDQLDGVVRLLRKNPNTRRAVLQVWNSEEDLESSSKDLPCNTAIYLKIRNNHLHMTVCNRSNDIIWGAYGVNIVQFSTILEYLAMRIGVPAGTLYQVSDSFHVYIENPVWKRFNHIPPQAVLKYPAPYKMAEGIQITASFDEDLRMFFMEDYNFITPYFKQVVLPLWYSWRAWIQKGLIDAKNWALECEATDWQRAVEIWLEEQT